VSPFRRFHRDAEAQALAEFALVLPVIFLVVFGVFDLARAVWQENTLAYAAREGTRYAIVHGSAGNPVAWPSGGGSSCSTAAPVPACQPIFDAVRNASVGVPNITVTVTWPDLKGSAACYDRNCRVAVDATAPFTPLPSQYLMGGAFQITLKGGSMLVIQR
jgi:hypothetical protein